MMSMYSRVRASGFSKGWPYQPSTTWGPLTPSPQMTRPSERCWSVFMAMAVAVGVRADSWMMLWPSLMLVVWEPYQARGVRASEPQASAVHSESKPMASAARTVSRVSGTGPRPQ